MKGVDDCELLLTSVISKENVGDFGGNYTYKPSINRCACLRKKNIGKSYAGKSHVRFDEGELRKRYVYSCFRALYSIHIDSLRFYNYHFLYAKTAPLKSQYDT
jgi:hypothetical protein